MTTAKEVLALMEMPGPSTSKWMRLSPKEKANIKAYLEKNSNVPFNQSLLKDMNQYGSLTDAQLAKLPVNAYR